MATARSPIAALAALILLTPAGAWAGDRYGVDSRRVDGERAGYEASEAYAYRRVERSSRSDSRYAEEAWAGDDRYAERRAWEEEDEGFRYRREESGWREASADHYDDRDRGWDNARDDLACERPRDRRADDRHDDHGRHDGCGEIRLPGSFFYGATGGVGPEYIDAGGGGGGVVIVGGSAGAGASAYASARASVGVSIRIGGGGRGRPGRPGGGHPLKGGCGCGH